MSSTVGIAGITGKLSQLILQYVLKSPNTQVRGFCRDASKLSADVREDSRIKVVEGDVYDINTLRKFVAGCNVVICGYLGDNELMEKGQKLLIDACEAEGVPRYIASDYSLDYNNLEYGQHPAKDPMKKVKEYASSKKAVEGVHILIGAFMNTFWSRFFGIWDPDSETISYWGSGKESWETTTYDNAAKFIAEVALDSNATGVQKYLGDTKTFPQIAETFEQVYGRKPTLKNLGSLDELNQKMHEQFKKDPEDLTWMPLFYQYYGLNGQGYLGEVHNKYGIEPETFADYMRTRSPKDL